MPKSYIEKVTDTMHQLLWTNLLEQFVRMELAVALAAIPIIGTTLAAIFALKPIQDVVLYFISKYIEFPLFNVLARFGVFTSIDWKEDGIYSAYEEEAKKLVPLQDKEVWDPKDEKTFTDSARSLIRFHLSA